MGGCLRWEVEVFGVVGRWKAWIGRAEELRRKGGLERWVCEGARHSAHRDDARRRRCLLQVWVVLAPSPLRAHDAGRLQVGIVLAARVARRQQLCGLHGSPLWTHGSDFRGCMPRIM